MIHPRQHDLVAGLEAAGQATRDRWKVSVVMFWPKTISSGLAAWRKAAIFCRASSMIAPRLDRGGEMAAKIGIGADQAIGHALDDEARDLRAARIVEIDARLAVVLEGERRKLRADGADVDRHGVTGNVCCGERQWPAGIAGSGDASGRHITP